MALKKYLKLKRGGYVTLIFLLSSMLIVIPLLAFTFGRVIKFNDLTSMLIRQKQEEIAVLTSVNESVEYLLTSGMYYILPDDALIDPSSSAELLIRENSEAMKEYTLSSEIYNMNYVISDDIDISDHVVMSDILNFPPSQRAVAGEKYFLIKTTIHKNKEPSYCKEIAVEITPSGTVYELWHREFVIY